MSTSLSRRPSTSAALHPTSDSSFFDHAVTTSGGTVSTTGPLSSSPGPLAETSAWLRIPALLHDRCDRRELASRAPPPRSPRRKSAGLEASAPSNGRVLRHGRGHRGGIRRHNGSQSAPTVFGAGPAAASSNLEQTTVNAGYGPDERVMGPLGENQARPVGSRERSAEIPAREGLCRARSLLW